MLYYKISTLEGQLLGAVSSVDLRYYNTRHKKIYCCFEQNAQYVYLNQKFYRPGWFNSEDPAIAGKYPEVLCDIISEEEYNEIRKNQNLV